MKRKIFFTLALTMGTMGTLAAQQSTNTPNKLIGHVAEKPADPPAPKITLAPSPVKDELYSAVHKRDTAEKQIADLNSRFLQLQQQATQQLQQLQAQDKQAADAIEAAKTKAFASAKLDPAKYDLDLETMEFSPKPAPAPEVKK
jgi:hypothetical protein